MKFFVEELEQRDCPSIGYHTEFWYGGQIAVADYGFAPPGYERVALQDKINAMPLFPGAGFHPTPLMPVPQWSGANIDFLFQQQPSQLFEIDSWTVPQPGGDLYWNQPKDQWLVAQDFLYGKGEPGGGIWGQWLVNQQAAVQQADEALFAAQDAYWASQSNNVVQQAPTISDPLAGNVLVVEALLKQNNAN